MEANNLNSFLRQAQSYGQNVAEGRDRLKNLGEAFTTSKIQSIFEKNLLASDEDRERAEAISSFATSAGFAPQGLQAFGEAMKKVRARKAAREAAKGRGTDATATDGAEAGSDAQPTSLSDSVSNASVRQSASDAMEAGARNTSEGIELQNLGSGPEETVIDRTAYVPRSGTRLLSSRADLARSANVGPQDGSPGFDADMEGTPLNRPAPSVSSGRATVESEVPDATPDAGLPQTANVGPQTDSAMAADPEAGALGADAGADAAAAPGADLGADAAVSATDAALAAGGGALATTWEFLGPLGIFAGIAASAIELGLVLGRKEPTPGQPTAVRLNPSSQGRVQTQLAPSMDTAATTQGGISAF